MRNIKRVWGVLVTAAVLVIGSTAGVSALQSSSASYGVDETFFGSGGELNACSTTYCTKQSTGETAVGNSASNSYQIQAGNNTDRQPYIEFVVNNTNIDLGKLTPTTTKTATATFSVRSYLSSGYTVLNASQGPANGNYLMNLLSTPTASSVGSEQFGINLVNNTTACGAPADFGANPAQDPDATFAYGQVASGYNTCGLFKYKQGDAVAYSNQSSSFTNYTVSYLFNISGITPGGTYTMNHVLVATSTY